MAGHAFTVLAPSGRLDAAGAQTFEADWKKELAAGHTHLLVDLTETRYISSGGLRSILAAVRHAQKLGGVVKICCAASHVIEVFEMAGFDQVLEIFPTRSLAESSFK